MLYSSPYDPSPPPFTFDPRATYNFINASQLLPGTYLFTLYASDLQAQVPCTWNVTILGNQMVAVVENDFVIPFDFYAGNIIGHECTTYPPSPTISVNGNYSYRTNPLIPMYYQWYQISGSPLVYDCDPLGFRPTRGMFKTNESIMEFVPPSVGLYGFQLVLSDGVNNVSSRYVYVQVNPNFGQPNSTMTPLPNYTNPPTRLDSQSPIGHWPVMNFTLLILQN